ncbi:MAG: hypothetical protein QW051_02820 [Candidatus Aenigmatarchaeota archaeon]
MFNRKKAQTEAIALVLIAGIIISLASAAYMWGKPMIEKRSVITQFSSALRFMEELDKKIVSIAGSCSSIGSCEDTLTLPVNGLISVDDANNRIVYEFVVSQPLLTKGEIFFNTGDNSSVARYGETPSIISLKGEKKDGQYMLIFYLRYRELDSYEPWKGYIIQLNSEGKKTGTNKIMISYDGSETKTSGAHHKGDLLVSKIKVQPI